MPLNTPSTLRTIRTSFLGKHGFQTIGIHMDLDSWRWEMLDSVDVRVIEYYFQCYFEFLVLVLKIWNQFSFKILRTFYSAGPVVIALCFAQEFFRLLDILTYVTRY